MNKDLNNLPISVSGKTCVKLRRSADKYMRKESSARSRATPSRFRRLLSSIGSWFTPKPAISRPGRSSLEPLESRIAPATFVNAHIVNYTDTDGDHVTVTSSAPIFTKTNFTDVLTFTTPVGATAGTQILQDINLATSGITANIFGDSLSVLVKKGGPGDGLANVGSIESNEDLGHITIQGNLGKITAGNTTPGAGGSFGLASLNVNSLGGNGTGTAVTTVIDGPVGSIVIQHDLTDAAINVNSVTAGVKSNGNINSLFIGGNFVGGSDGDGGFITTAGSIGSFYIGGDMQGGSGTASAAIRVGGQIGSFSVNNLVGYTIAGDTSGAGEDSASITTGTNFEGGGGIGHLTIRGSIEGGDGSGSAEISQTNVSTGSYAVVKIGGAITGGSGDNSGEITANAFGSISVAHGITGSSGTSSGSIVSTGGIASLSIISGGIMGGTNTNAGAVTADGALGSAIIHGDITGNSSAGATIAGTGQVQAGSVGAFTLYGSLIGSTATGSGSLITQGAIGHIAINKSSKTATDGSILGGAGDSSGEISAGSIAGLSVAGDIGISTAAGTASGAVVSTGAIGNISILGGLLGGTAANTGEITGTSIHSLSIGGQLLGASANTGEVLTSGSIGSVLIGHGITGGTGDSSGVIITGSGAGFGANIGSLTVMGGITGEMGDNSGQVSVGGAIGSIHLNGAALKGGAGTDSGSIFANDNIGPATFGSIITGAGPGSGQLSTGGNLTALGVTGTAGSTTAVSGIVTVGGSAGTISVHGDIVGSSDSTGLFQIGGAVRILSVSGDLIGGTGALDGGTGTGTGADSGAIFVGGDGVSGIAHASIGDIIGGAGVSSGSLVSNGTLGAIAITGAGAGVTANSVTTHGVIGGSGDYSGQINSASTITSVSVKGALQGAGGVGSGSIVSNSMFTPSGDIQGNIGSIGITGSVMGGGGQNSGQISVAGNINILSITGDVTGRAVSGTGAILAGTQLTAFSGGNITSLKIGGALQGAAIPNGTGTVTGSGYIEAGHIGTAVIGSIQAGSVGTGNTVFADGAILAANDIASLTVTGAITGDSTNPVNISAAGQVTPGKTDLAFGKIAVGKDVTYANILAGYDQTLSPVNGAASIGSVIVGGNWSGSNLVAGVETSPSGPYGGANLVIPGASVIPTIASIIIKGQIVSVGAAADTYGFVSGKVEALSIAGKAQPVGLDILDLDPVSGQPGDTMLHSLS